MQINLLIFISFVEKTSQFILQVILFLGFTIFMLYQYSVKDLKVLKADAHGR